MVSQNFKKEGERLIVENLKMSNCFFSLILSFTNQTRKIIKYGLCRRITQTKYFQSSYSVLIWRARSLILNAKFKWDVVCSCVIRLFPTKPSVLYSEHSNVEERSRFQRILFVSYSLSCLLIHSLNKTDWNSTTCQKRHEGGLAYVSGSRSAGKQVD